MLVEHKLNKLQKCAWWHVEVLFLLYTAAQFEGIVFIQSGLCPVPKNQFSAELSSSPAKECKNVRNVDPKRLPTFLVPEFEKEEETDDDTMSQLTPAKSIDSASMTVNVNVNSSPELFPKTNQLKTATEQFLLKGKFRNISLVSVYAPTEDSDEVGKDSFYDLIAAEYDKLPKYDTIKILGDFNAKVGKETYLKPVAGKYSMHEECNENGRRIIQFAVEKNLIIKSTCFPHKNIHKGTWRIPGTQNVNQIDHVLISARHASSITDVRSLRGPNCDSDHYLVRAVLRERLALAQATKGERRIKWDVEKLRQAECRTRFEEEMERQLPNKPSETPEEFNSNRAWNDMKHAMTEVIKNTVGEKRIERNGEWFDEECSRALQRKNEAWRDMMGRETRLKRERYKEIRRTASKICRKKKREWQKKRLEDIETAYLRNDVGGFYQRVDTIKRGYQPRLKLCKDQEGQIIGEENKVLETWEEYFKEQLSIERDNEEFADEIMTAEPLVEPPTMQEVQEAIDKLKSNKAPGSDYIPAEVYKCGGQKLTRLCHELITGIWVSEEMLDEWKRGIICPIFKKGDKLMCNNYRGKTLLNIAYKIFSTIIFKRVTLYAEEELSEVQCEFRNNRGTTDQIFVMRQTMEKCYEFDVDLHIVFVDFRQAFDSVDRKQLPTVLTRCGLPRKLVKMA
ncbi:uncharacterized protein LOC111055532 [Nilaparvata lugens]|uniref:uncharacterized protein LOC111055532 n=1 Tax=Nilaparvata lugens TaxID=108931 RepID=UPI00193D9C8D|nr:uncharacterized protein LOC111055532 [Nilaparvata lugens]